MEYNPLEQKRINKSRKDHDKKLESWGAKTKPKGGIKINSYIYSGLYDEMIDTGLFGQNLEARLRGMDEQELKFTRDYFEKKTPKNTQESKDIAYIIAFIERILFEKANPSIKLPKLPKFP